METLEILNFDNNDNNLNIYLKTYSYSIIEKKNNLTLSLSFTDNYPNLMYHLIYFNRKS